jgi:hypothetical protein
VRRRAPCQDTPAARLRGGIGGEPHAVECCEQPKIIGIAVTGHLYAADIQRSEEVGIQLHLTKPTTMQQLQAAIVGLFPEQAAAFKDRTGGAKPEWSSPQPGLRRPCRTKP